jgi:hypothetical protein
MGMGLFYVTVLVIFFLEWVLRFCCVFEGGSRKLEFFLMVFCGGFVVDEWFYVVSWMVVFWRLKNVAVLRFIFWMVWKFRIWELVHGKVMRPVIVVVWVCGSARYSRFRREEIQNAAVDDGSWDCSSFDCALLDCYADWD